VTARALQQQATIILKEKKRTVNNKQSTKQKVKLNSEDEFRVA